MAGKSKVQIETGLLAITHNILKINTLKYSAKVSSKGVVAEKFAHKIGRGQRAFRVFHDSYDYKFEDPRISNTDQSG